MSHYAHNFNEMKALIKEAIRSGSIFDFDNTVWLSHETDLHIADVYINNLGEVVARTYNHRKGSINFTTIGSVND